MPNALHYENNLVLNIVSLFAAWICAAEIPAQQENGLAPWNGYNAAACEKFADETGYNLTAVQKKEQR